MDCEESICDFQETKRRVNTRIITPRKRSKKTTRKNLAPDPGKADIAKKRTIKVALPSQKLIVPLTEANLKFIDQSNNILDSLEHQIEINNETSVNNNCTSGVKRTQSCASSVVHKINSQFPVYLNKDEASLTDCNVPFIQKTPSQVYLEEQENIFLSESANGKQIQENVSECVISSSELEKSKWWCIICKESFPWEIRDTHFIECIKTYKYKNCTIDGKHDTEEETFSFVCDICKQDISHMNILERSEHMNRCIDSQVESTSPNMPAQPSEQKSFFITDCPLCLKHCSTIDARLVHIKRCSKTLGIDVQSVIIALQLQEKHTIERINLGLPPLQQRYSMAKPNQKPRKRTAKEPKSKADSDMQLAKALSISLNEEKKRAELLQFVTIDTVDSLSNGSTNGNPVAPAQLLPPNNIQRPGKRKKKNDQNKPIPVLLLRSHEERIKLLQERVSSIIAPLAPTIELVEEISNKDAVTEDVETLLSASVCNKQCHLWNLSSGADEKEAYYVTELMDFVTPSEIVTGSKLQNLSQVPGHKICTQQPYDYTFSCTPKPKEDDSISQSSKMSALQLPSTQEMLDIITDQSQTNEKYNCVNNCHSQAENRNNGFFCEENVQEKEKESNPVIEDLQTLVGNAWMSDIDVYVADEKIIPAHKLILVLRCPALKQNLGTTIECMNSNIDWSDFSYEVAINFLNFLYTGFQNWDYALNKSIFQLAHRCGIQELQGVATEDSYEKMEFYDDPCSSGFEGEPINKYKNVLLDKTELAQNVKEPADTQEDNGHSAEIFKIQENVFKIPKCGSLMETGLSEDKGHDVMVEEEENSATTTSRLSNHSNDFCVKNSVVSDHRNEILDVQNVTLDYNEKANISPSDTLSCNTIQADTLHSPLAIPSISNNEGVIKSENCLHEAKEFNESIFKNSGALNHVHLKDKQNKFISEHREAVFNEKKCDVSVENDKFNDSHCMDVVNESLNSTVNSPDLFICDSDDEKTSPVNFSTIINSLDCSVFKSHSVVSAPYYTASLPRKKKFVHCNYNNTTIQFSPSDNNSKSCRTNLMVDFESKTELLSESSNLIVDDKFSSEENCIDISEELSIVKDTTTSPRNKNSPTEKFYINKTSPKSLTFDKGDRNKLYSQYSSNRISSLLKTDKDILNFSSESRRIDDKYETFKQNDSISGNSFPAFIKKSYQPDNENVAINSHSCDSSLVFNKDHCIDILDVVDDENVSHSAIKSIAHNHSRLLNMSVSDKMEFEDVKNCTSSKEQSFSKCPVSTNSSFTKLKRNHSEPTYMCNVSPPPNSPIKFTLSEDRLKILKTDFVSKTNLSQSKDSVYSNGKYDIQYNQNKDEIVIEEINCTSPDSEKIKLSNRRSQSDSPITLSSDDDDLPGKSGQENLPSVWEDFDEGYTDYVFQDGQNNFSYTSLKELPSTCIKNVQSTFQQPSTSEPMKIVLSDDEQELEPLQNRIFGCSKKNKIDKINIHSSVPSTMQCIDIDDENSNELPSISQTCFLDDLPGAKLKDYEESDLHPITENDNITEALKQKTPSPKRPLNNHLQLQKKAADYKISDSPITPLPDYKSMVTPEIKDALKKFGIRALPRKKAVAILAHIYDETHPWEGEQEISDGRTQVPTSSVEGASSSTSAKQPSKKRKNISVKSGKTASKSEVVKKPRTAKAISKKSPKKTSSQNQLISSEINYSQKSTQDSISSSQNSSKSDLSDMPEESVYQQDSENEDFEVNICIKAKINDYIRSNELLYAKILMYEPLNLHDFQKELEESGIKISIAKLMDYFDEECITFTVPRSENAKKKQQARSQRFRKRVITKLSQQSSQNCA